MEDMGEGLVLGALLGGGFGGGRWGGNCGGNYGGCGHHSFACGETLEGLSRTLHSNDTRNELRNARIEARLDHAHNKLCDIEKQAWQLHSKTQDREIDKQEKEIFFLKGQLWDTCGRRGNKDDNDGTTINIGNQLSSLTSAVNSVLGAMAKQG